MEALRELDKDDLVQIGLPLGHRKALLKAIAALPPATRTTHDSHARTPPTAPTKTQARVCAAGHGVEVSGAETEAEAAESAAEAADGEPEAGEAEMEAGEGAGELEEHGEMGHQGGQLDGGGFWESVGGGEARSMSIKEKRAAKEAAKGALVNRPP